MTCNFRPITAADRDALRAFISSFWRSERMVARGRLFFPAEQEGFVAEKDGQFIGLITFERSGDAVEITLLDSRERQQGIGSRLVELALEYAKNCQCSRVWLVTTNDNIRAIRFYQKRGFNLVALHRNALEAARLLKPEIPMTGQDGIPIRHELEFCITL
ncbi:MAG: GNAT family N-acetyltransferase [Saprospiraceae bacterium]|nr:GNAT family N-acetyltransferase [Saprospiraceae bacterium]